MIYIIIFLYLSGCYMLFHFQEDKMREDPYAGIGSMIIWPILSSGTLIFFIYDYIIKQIKKDLK